jgi:hypothetical protein
MSCITSSGTRFRFSDHTVATFLLGTGIASLMVAHLRNPNMWSMTPGMDGALCMGILGFAALILHRVDYRTTLMHLLPVFGIQLGCALLNDVSGFTLVGMQALLFGVVGLLVSKPSDRAAPRELRLVRLEDHR